MRYETAVRRGASATPPPPSASLDCRLARWSRSRRGRLAGRRRVSSLRWWGRSVLDLPFGFAGYRLSRRYGLSRQRRADGSPTGRRGSASAPCSASRSPRGLILIQRGGGRPVAAPGVGCAVAFGGLLAALCPVLLLPLFLKSERMAEGALADEMWATARAAGVKVRELRLLKMGEKTAAANAMVAGLGPTVRSTSPTRSPSPRRGRRGERARAHAGRPRARARAPLHRDIWRLLDGLGGTTGAGVAGAWAAVEGLAPDGAGHVTALPAAALGFSLGSAVVSPFVAAYSRRRERAADAYAVGARRGGGDVRPRARAARRPQPQRARAAPAVLPADGVAPDAGRADRGRPRGRARPGRLNAPATYETLTRCVVPVVRSRTKMSATPFVSPATRLRGERTERHHLPVRRDGGQITRAVRLPLRRRHADAPRPVQHAVVDEDVGHDGWCRRPTRFFAGDSNTTISPIGRRSRRPWRPDSPAAPDVDTLTSRVFDVPRLRTNTSVW